MNIIAFLEPNDSQNAYLRKSKNVPENCRAVNVPRFLPVMFLEFVSNLPKNFRNITYEIQEFFPQKYQKHL